MKKKHQPAIDTTLKINQLNSKKKERNQENYPLNLFVYK